MARRILITVTVVSMLLGLLCLALGCAGDQARAAANADACIQRSALVGPLTDDQALLLGGAVSECQAIINSTEPGTMPTIDTTAAPARMAEQARAHAGTVRSVGAQAASSVWTWVLSAAGLAATALLGGGGGMLVARQGARGLLDAALRFGSEALARLREANPLAGQQVVAQQKAIQEAQGVRDQIRAAIRRLPESTAVFDGTGADQEGPGG